MTEASDYAQQRLEQENYERDLITWVQKRLKQLGYVGGGEADGVLNHKTQGEILDFRNRNKLPLVPEIDDELIEWLKRGPSIELPHEQVIAQSPEISTKVEAVKETLWTKFWAKVILIPSGVISLVTGIIDNFDQAVTALQPLRSMLDQGLASVSPLTLMSVSFGLTTVIAALIWYTSGTTESALTKSYQEGTLKNDNMEVGDLT